MRDRLRKIIKLHEDQQKAILKEEDTLEIEVINIVEKLIEQGKEDDARAVSIQNEIRKVKFAQERNTIAVMTQTNVLGEIIRKLSDIEYEIKRMK